MNVNGISANKNLIDAASASKVSEQLFTALSKKSVDYSKANLSKFNRPTMGVDFYNGKADISVQREIAMANSGAFQTLNLKSVQALNAFAAQQMYSSNVQDKVGGKMTIDAQGNDFEFISEVEDAQNLINVFETLPDKKDSNPFAFGEFHSQAKSEEA